MILKIKYCHMRRVQVWCRDDFAYPPSALKVANHLAIRSGLFEFRRTVILSYPSVLKIKKHRFWLHCESGLLPIRRGEAGRLPKIRLEEV